MGNRVLRREAEEDGVAWPGWVATWEGSVGVSGPVFWLGEGRFWCFWLCLRGKFLCEGE